MLLEKPAEMLLGNKNIDLPFCFSWANEPWARTWDGKAHQVLMPQDYGGKEDWISHFNYLLPFFKDERYIKVDGCPMFILYKPHSIPHAKEMMEVWNSMAINEGFKGVHFVETLRGTTRDKRNLPFKSYVEFEPARTNYSHSIFALTYNRIRRRIYEALRVNMEYIPEKHDYIFVVYDKETGKMSFDKLVALLGELVAESKV